MPDLELTSLSWKILLEVPMHNLVFNGIADWNVEDIRFLHSVSAAERRLLIDLPLLYCIGSREKLGRRPTKSSVRDS